MDDRAGLAWKEQFDVFDADRSGLVSIDEFRKVLAGIGQNMPYEQARKLFTSFDTDHDGQISFEEFMVLALSMDSSTGEIRPASHDAVRQAADIAGQTLENTEEVLASSHGEVLNFEAPGTLLKCVSKTYAIADHFCVAEGGYTAVNKKRMRGFAKRRLPGEILTVVDDPHEETLVSNHDFLLQNERQTKLLVLLPG